MTTFMIAWHRTMHTPLTNSTERECTFPLLCQRSLVFIRTHMHRGSSFMFAPSHHLHGHPRACSLFDLILPFYFLLYLMSLFLFLNYLKCVVNLHNSCNESMDSTDEFSLSTDFYETSVEPYVQLLDSPPLFSNKVSSADPDYDDATLEDMLRQVHRAQGYHSLREDLCVSLSSSSMSDRTGRPVGDRSGRPGEHRNSEAQIRTLLDNQIEQILAECHARINQHEFQAARAEEDQRLLHGQLLQQNLELREAHQRSLTEMEELRKFQSSIFDTMARRKLAEDQDTILELTGKIQELQNEINCMNDSRDFLDTIARRRLVEDQNTILELSGPIQELQNEINCMSDSKDFHSHLIEIPEGMLSRSFGVPSRREGPPSIWDTHLISGNVFCKSRCVFISTLSTRIARESEQGGPAGETSSCTDC